MSTVRSYFKILSAAAFAAALVFITHSAVSAEKKEPKKHVVTIQGMVFSPQTLHISRGDTISWVNNDIVPHAVKSTDPKKPWESTMILQKGSWEQVFKEGGPYFCPYHPTMTGEIIVDE